MIRRVVVFLILISVLMLGISWAISLGSSLILMGTLLVVLAVFGPLFLAVILAYASRESKIDSPYESVYGQTILTSVTQSEDVQDEGLELIVNAALVFLWFFIVASLLTYPISLGLSLMGYDFDIFSAISLELLAVNLGAWGIFPFYNWFSILVAILMIVYIIGYSRRRTEDLIALVLFVSNAGYVLLLVDVVAYLVVSLIVSFLPLAIIAFASGQQLSSSTSTGWRGANGAIFILLLLSSFITIMNHILGETAEASSVLHTILSAFEL